MAWADEVYPTRPRSLEEWMETVGYYGKQIVPLYEQSCVYSFTKTRGSNIATERIK